MESLKIITKIADSVAKFYGCRLRYEDSETIYYEGPEDCKDFIIEEANNFLIRINLPTIDSTNVKMLLREGQIKS